ncbi:helix-turn-helix domain-containing protein [Actinobacillus equuli]|uniref:helix-turn-helix domain-containing protein n=1 Tax=Actinobacillus equuli TaxID=718 RepID=UPI002442AA4C|nr:helix-turn-helix transcriptional regulator [Actinobacillus equuli]WGE60017.1 helix-turn-helix domain-containing protein [Actinobacillus equuli subsp. haemolyticus]WGE61335.1 helix-turn-helix domain-containing protein [Actinobacillus equuli subsp. haemolyticus]
MSIKERLREVIDLQNMSIKAFSDSMQIPLRTLHNYLSGEREPSAEVLVKIATELNINLNWLLIGKGNMYLINNTELNLEELKLLENYRLTSEAGKKILQFTSQSIYQELK